MSYLSGVSREQVMLLPESVEDYVGADNPVRVVDAFIEGLDLKCLGFESRAEGAPGAPQYHPRAMLKLFVYGYLNRIRSSRELEKTARRNLEVIWLLRRLRPDHWTINAFRREHRDRFKAVFRQFNLVCGSLGLFGADLVAIDGTFLKAVNNPQRNFTQAKAKGLIEEIDRRSEAYLQELETADRQSSAQSMAASDGAEGAQAIRSKLAAMEQKRAQCWSCWQPWRAVPPARSPPPTPAIASLAHGILRSGNSCLPPISSHFHRKARQGVFTQSLLRPGYSRRLATRADIA